MANDKTDQTSGANDVRILAPDTALKQKLGNDVTFERVVTPQLAVAEQVITDSSAELLAAVQGDLHRLREAAGFLTLGAPADTALPPVIEAAFAIKSSAGLCGYPFASRLAKSLHLFCELDSVRQQPLTAKSIDIIRCQVKGLETVFTLKITGDGGKVGEAILAELQKLSAGFQVGF